MAIAHRLLPVGAALLFLLLCGAASGSGVQSVLKKFGIPKGVLPRAKHHSIATNGLLSVKLKAPCYVKYSDIFFYDQTVTGWISYGAIYNLTGVQVNKYYQWLPVFAVTVHPYLETVEFQLATFSLSYSVDEFEHNPDCLKSVSMIPGGGGADEVLPDAEV